MAFLTSYSKFVTVITNREITTRDIINFIQILETKNTFKTPYKFYPEPITEGGLVLDWPGRKKGQYKTIRLGLHNKWPRISATSRWDWENSPPIEISSGKRFTLFIKAFYGAPCWTRDELSTVKTCIKKLSFVKKIVGRIPVKKNLCRNDPHNGKPSDRDLCEHIFSAANSRLEEELPISEPPLKKHKVIE